MSKDADILQMRMQIIGMSEDIHNYQAALTEKEAELAAARGKLNNPKIREIIAYNLFRAKYKDSIETTMKFNPDLVPAYANDEEHIRTMWDANGKDRNLYYILANAAIQALKEAE